MNKPRLDTAKGDAAMYMTLYAPADEGEKYLPEAGESLIGSRVPITQFGELVFLGLVREATVVDEGKALKIVVEVPKNAPDPAELLRFLSGAEHWAD